MVGDEVVDAVTLVADMRMLTDAELLQVVDISIFDVVAFVVRSRFRLRSDCYNTYPPSCDWYTLINLP